MTDTRLPEQWLGDPTLDALSDAALRVHWNALIWSVKYGRDGLVLRTALRLLHPEGARPEAVEELLAAGLWRRRGDDFEIVGFLDSQSSAQDVERQKARNRAKTKAYRQREAQAAAASSEVLTDAVTGVVTGHVTRSVTGVVGQDRTGKGSKTEEEQNPAPAPERTREEEPERLAAPAPSRADAAGTAPLAVPAPATVAPDGWPLSVAARCPDCDEALGNVEAEHRCGTEDVAREDAPALHEWWSKDAERAASEERARARAKAERRGAVAGSPR